MIVFSLKLLNNVRKAIAGRKFPHQLAGGVALGVLLGIIPHGNLLALIVLTAVLCFKINHAMMGVVAIGVSFGATRLDPYSHQVGEALLHHPRGREFAEQAWALPGVAWTDLNNTVVLGSFVIGLLAVLPIFLITLPVFRLIAPANAPAESGESGADAGGEVTDRQDAAHPVAGPTAPRKVTDDQKVTDDRGAGLDAVALSGNETVTTPPQIVKPQDSRDVTPATSKTIPVDDVLASEPVFLPIEESSDTPMLPSQQQMEAVQTRIDVIRMKDFQSGDAESGAQPAEAAGAKEQSMDEALSFLLQQLRHSQQRKAAG